MMLQISGQSFDDALKNAASGDAENAYLGLGKGNVCFNMHPSVENIACILYPMSHFSRKDNL